jgi:hypothetical protein
MRVDMARDKNDRGRPGAGTRDEFPSALDKAVSGLFKRGLLDSREPSRVPVEGEVDPARVEASRRESMRAGIRVVLRDARLPVQGCWLGQWLQAVRLSARLRTEEVAFAVGVDAALWRELETRPLQVAALDVERAYIILDLFSLPYSAAETCIRGSLQRPGLTTSRVFARTTSSLPDESWTRRFSEFSVPRVPPRAQSNVEEMLKALHTTLQQRGRKDLLEDRLD